MTIAATMEMIRDKYRTDAANLQNVLQGGDLEVLVRDAPWDKDNIYKGITVWWPRRIGEDPGANKLDDFLYPIMVTYVRGKAGTVDAVTNDIDEFWDRSRELHHYRRLTADSTVLRTTVRSGQVVLPDLWKDDYIASQLAVIVKRRHIRN